MGGNDDDPDDECLFEAGVQFSSEEGTMYYFLVFGYGSGSEDEERVLETGDFFFVVENS